MKESPHKQKKNSTKKKKLTLDPELEELVLKKSVGNPFFCTEFVAHLTQSDMLEVVEEKVKLRADKKAILNQVGPKRRYWCDESEFF